MVDAVLPHLGELQVTAVVVEAMTTAMVVVEAQHHLMVAVEVQHHQEVAEAVEAAAVDMKAEVVNLRFFYL